MKVVLLLMLLSVTASAEGLSGKWKWDSCRLLQGSSKCESNIDILDLKISENLQQVCYQYSYSDGAPEQTFCGQAYDRSELHGDPMKDIVDKKEITIHENQLSSTITQQSGGERRIYSLTLSKDGKFLAMYDYIFYYQYSKSTGTWERTSKWQKEHFFSSK